MIMESIKSHPYTLRLFNNPTEEMCLEAVKRNGDLLCAINNPSDAVKIAALENYGFAIAHINNPTDEMKLLACKQNGLAIENIDVQSDEIKWTALKQNPLCFSYIINPTEEMMLFSFETLVKNNKIFDIIHKVSFSDINKIEYCLQKSQENKILKYYFKKMLEQNKKIEFENKFDLL